jgi:outer membrane lipoprotein-sorting protein
MRKHLVVLASVLMGLTVVTARAQPEPPPRPNFDGAMAKLFGDNTGFSANMEFHVTRSSGREMIVLGKIAVLEGKSRFDMDLSTMQGGHMPPQAAARMKQMGMGKMTAITLRDKKLSYIIYPDMKAYMENAALETGAAPAEYKTEVTKLGEETIDGHDCVKNKVVVTGPDGVAHESTVWNASDLNQFPVKIQTTSEKGTATVMLFKDVKMDKPDATQFDLPADFTKYDSMMSLIMSRARGAPPQ